VPDCAICLQPCVHPARLPCRHVFCFLCAKGVALQSRRCALCRSEIPPDFLERPTLLCSTSDGVPLKPRTANAWYYEGRNGWWQYDERTSAELEEAFARGSTTMEMLIAGYLYVADLEAMVQYRRSEPSRRRKMKRDLLSAPKKGVAGLRLDLTAPAVSPAHASGVDGVDRAVAGTSSGSGSVVAGGLLASAGPSTITVASPSSPVSSVATSSTLSVDPLPDSGATSSFPSRPATFAPQHQMRAVVGPPSPADSDDSSDRDDEEQDYEDNEGAASISRQLAGMRLGRSGAVIDTAEAQQQSAAPRSATLHVRSRDGRPDGQYTVTDV
uniref:E3 ubiquitin-protein ligase n=1 Tax=Petromyzon marinus TaxID=7757 RepID=S4R4W7_PETMA